MGFVGPRKVSLGPSNPGLDSLTSPLPRGMYNSVSPTNYDDLTKGELEYIVDYENIYSVSCLVSLTPVVANPVLEHVSSGDSDITMDRV